MQSSSAFFAGNGGLTQEQLAQDVNVSRTTVSRWESGRLIPDIDTIRRLSRVLDYNFFTVEGLTADAIAPAGESAGEEKPAECLPQTDPAQEEDAPVQEAPARPMRRKTWYACAALLILALILVLAWMLSAPAAGAQITASAAEDVVYLEPAEQGGMRWLTSFTFENSGSIPFRPDSVEIIYYAGDVADWFVTVPREELRQLMHSDKLCRGDPPLEIPVMANVLTLTRVVCRIYGSDDRGRWVEEEASALFSPQIGRRIDQGITADQAEPDAAQIVVTTSKDIAFLEPFDEQGYGWQVNFYFENLTGVAFRPDKVETIYYENDQVYMTLERGYEQLRPFMSNGMLYKGGIPLLMPVGSNQLSLTHVYCHIVGTDENGHPIDVGATVRFSQEYRPLAGQ